MIARETPSASEPGRSNPSDFDGGAPRSDPNPGDSGGDPSPFDPLLRHISELQMLAGHYLRARADQILGRVRRALLWTIAAAIGLIIAVAFLATAVVLVLRGIADGLMLLGLQPWAAELLTGVICIAAVALIMAVAAFSQNGAARRKERETTMSTLEHATERNSATASTKPVTMGNEPAGRESSCHEAAAAKAAIRRVIKDTRHSLGSAVDPRLWTKKSPWIAIGVAAAAGMAAAVFLRRSGSRGPTNGEAARAARNPPAGNSSPSAPAQSGIGAAIASSLFDLAKFGLETAIMNGIRKNAAPNPPPTDYRNETASAAQ